MKPRYLLLSAAVIAVGAGGVLTANAQPGRDRAERHERHRAHVTRIDANNDKFVTRAEAQAETERVFAELDGNNDGKLDATDRQARRDHMVRRMEMRRGERTETAEDVITGPGDAAPGDGKQREVIIHREIRKDGEGHHRGGPGRHGPRMHGPPMFTMIFANSEEADRNNDSALSKEEFVAQQLRFFDAADANGDGKIKFDPPQLPDLPTPPKPPTPPTPPRP